MDSGEITYAMVTQVIGKTGKFPLSAQLGHMPLLVWHFSFIVCSFNTLFRLQRRNYASEGSVYEPNPKNFGEKR